MLHCSFIEDKIEIVKNTKHFETLCLNCGKDEGDIRYFLKKMQKLRNNLAHSNHMRSNFKNWGELLETIKICRVLTFEMKRFL
ncbi:hypothetical protein LCGC14_2275200 [marine sediment metagenome]|uniref:RiboL-PSP-HEPN domain-containing protein n=1 Tax=marine sediment metagenome TaxID=412755 RepID=A0A0F9CVS5_9ZZZZ